MTPDSNEILWSAPCGPAPEHNIEQMREGEIVFVRNDGTWDRFIRRAGETIYYGKRKCPQNNA